MPSDPIAAGDRRETIPRVPTFAAALQPSAFLAAFGVSVRQMARPKRLLTLAILFLLPLLVLGPARLISAQDDSARYTAEVATSAEEFLGLILLPSVLVPLIGLFLASGMIRDEIEGQTLTYLLVRPLWRPALYATKWKAAWLVSLLLTAATTPILLATVNIGIFEPSDWLPRCGYTVALFALALLAYTGVFGLLSMITKRGALLGIVYLLAFEQAFAYTDFVLRKGTVLYHYRALALRWLYPGSTYANSWSMELSALPEPSTSILTLGGVGVGSVLLGALLFRLREFRMKGAGGD